MNIDAHQLDDFARQLALAPARKKVLVAAAIKKGAQNIKTAIRADLDSSSNAGFRRIPIAYEIHEKGNEVVAEIGPRGPFGRGPGHPGSLANIAFFGSARGGGTHKFYEHGIAEFDTTAKYVQKAAGDLV